MKLVKIALAVALVLAISTSASAIIINLSASMDCAQANAGAGTCAAGGTGTGTASITLDDATNLLSWNISWSGLSGTAFAMHFHGPALPNQNAGVQVSTGILGPPVVGNAFISVAQAADLLAGLWYLNLHTTTFGPGEIRGQVLSAPIPEPSGLLLFSVGMLVVGRATRRRAA